MRIKKDFLTLWLLLALSACNTGKATIPAYFTSTEGIPNPGQLSTNTPFSARATSTPGSFLPSLTVIHAFTSAPIYSPTSQAKPSIKCPEISGDSSSAPLVDFPEDPSETEKYALDYLNSYGPMPFIDYFKKNYQNLFHYQDLTNDGIPEIVLALGWPGIFIIGCHAGVYSTDFLVGVDGGTIPGQVKSIRDFNRDGIPELLSLTGIGLRSRFYRVVGWDGSEFRELIRQAPENDDPNTIGLLQTGYCGSVDFRDMNSDRIDELVLYDPVPPIECRFDLTGPILPWREKTEIFRWDRENYVLDRLEYGAPTYLFQAVQDGDRYAQKGDYEKALGFYLSVITNPKLGWWTPEREIYLQDTWNESTAANAIPPVADKKESPNLAAYAYYRIMLIDVLEGKRDTAEAIVSMLRTKYPGETAGYRYAELAAAFWDEYQSTLNMEKACNKVIQIVSYNPRVYLLYLGNYGLEMSGKYEAEYFHGTQSLEYLPGDLCPFK